MLPMRRAFVGAGRSEHRRGSFIHQKELDSGFPGLHKLRGIRRIGFFLQNGVQNLRFFRNHHKKGDAQSRVEHRQRQRHAAHIHFRYQGRTDPPRCLTWNARARKQGRRVSIFSQPKKNQVESRESAVI